jgi:hypothetical protein
MRLAASSAQRIRNQHSNRNAADASLRALKRAGYEQPEGKEERASSHQSYLGVKLPAVTGQASDRTQTSNRTR